MRTTLDIDDDVLAAAKEISRQQGLSAGAVVSALLRQALTGATPAPTLRGNRVPRAGVAGFRPFPSGGRVVTNDLVDRVRDVEGI